MERDEYGAMYYLDESLSNAYDNVCEACAKHNITKEQKEFLEVVKKLVEICYTLTDSIEVK